MNYTQHYKREYSSWNRAKNACLDKDNKRYPLYGALGVSFCKEWLDFEKFFKDMGELPDGCDGLILKDLKKGYNKFNCSWGKVKRGAKFTGERQKRPSQINRQIKKAMSFCISINADHYAYIKRQAILKSQQTNNIYSANDLIREALTRAYPFSGQFDMFGGVK